jgi:16S rRNA (guanine527-N7)-methyltransferase
MAADAGGADAGAAGGGRDASVETAIEAYRSLLQRYHRTLDLMSDRGLESLDEKLDDAWAYARAVATWAGPGCVLDVGSGAGLPGVVVAANLPERSVVWVERRRRRATFLGMVAAACELRRVEVVCGDVRTVHSDALPGPLAAVTAQAVAPWSDLYSWTRHLHGDRVVFVARRGAAWAEEVAALAQTIGAEPQVLATEGLGRGGTLVVLSVPGGCPCR